MDVGKGRGGEGEGGSALGRGGSCRGCSCMGVRGRAGSGGLRCQRAGRERRPQVSEGGQGAEASGVRGRAGSGGLRCLPSGRRCSNGRDASLVASQPDTERQPRCRFGTRVVHPAQPPRRCPADTAPLPSRLSPLSLDSLFSPLSARPAIEQLLLALHLFPGLPDVDFIVHFGDGCTDGLPMLSWNICRCAARTRAPVCQICVAELHTSQICPTSRVYLVAFIFRQCADMLLHCPLPYGPSGACRDRPHSHAYATTPAPSHAPVCTCRDRPHAGFAFPSYSAWQSSLGPAQLHHLHKCLMARCPYIWGGGGRGRRQSTAASCHLGSFPDGPSLS